MHLFHVNTFLCTFLESNLSTKCLLIRPRTDEENYLYITTPKRRAGKICHSNVGMTGGKQKLFISSQCTHVDLRHELGHTIGLYHEQSRSDRDDYVTIHENNIYPGRENNFKKCAKCWHFNMPYGYDSIMHYVKNGFSKSGDPTITPKVQFT